MFKYKTEVELSALTATERDQYAAEKRAHESTVLNAAIKTANEAERAEIQKLITAAKPEFMVSKQQFDELMETVNQLKENNGTDEKAVSLKTELEAQAEKIKTSISNKSVHEFVVKANVVSGSVTSNPNAQDLPTIGQLAHRKLTVYDMFRKIPVAKDKNGVIRYVDWDEATKVRAAAAILEAGTFPESTAKWATYTMALQKIGDSIPVSEEFMYDNAMFAAELEKFLQTNVAIKIDTDLIVANGTAPNINGLTNQVGTYTPAAAGITDASIYDLLVKVTESITTLYGSKYQPNVALMNIADINKMRLKKDANNNYVMPPFVTRDGNSVAGIVIFECNSVAANSMFVGDSAYGDIYEEAGFYVATGYDGSDWSSDMMTMKARKRMNLLIRTVDQTGWKKVTSISAALTTLAT